MSDASQELPPFGSGQGEVFVNQEVSGFGTHQSSGRGTLAHAARDRALKEARGLLIAIGLINTVVYGFQFASIREDIQQALAKKVAPGLVIDQKAVEAIVRSTQLYIGARIVLGIIFVLLGLIVARFPVPITVISLVLYLGANVISMVLMPSTIYQQIIFKIIVVVALVKAVQSAIAYDRYSADDPMAAPLS